MESSSLVKAAATVSACVVVTSSVYMLVQSFETTRDIQDYISGLRRSCSTLMTISIGGFSNLQRDRRFEDAMVYISTRVPFSSAKRLYIFRTIDDETNYPLVPTINEVFTDTFQGVKLQWILRCRQIGSNIGSMQVTNYDLTFPKKAEDLVRCSYLPFVSQVAASTRERMKTPRKLFSLDVTGTGMWRFVTLECPTNIHDIAIDPQFRRNITDDLPRAMVPTTSCSKPCKAYKRGYLLYGPTGIGKTGLIAAMAEYLKLDVYNLDLTQLSSNSQLQASLMATANYSILAVEDIHCLTELDNSGAEQVSLLDFMDRGWPNCGDQRIIVFTSNKTEVLDPAWLTPGRVDSHVYMP